MKKFLIGLLLVICFAGVGYLGYVIFQSKNIDTVEIVGDMKTLYLVGDDLDFGDAKLKVTYKNGNMKMVDMTKKNVKVTLFNTSLATHAKMKLTYKSAVLEQEYYVINCGYYYLSKAVTTSSVTQTRTLTINNTDEIMRINEYGQVLYYSKKNGNWYLNDGEYDSSYNYTITGDTMNVSLGGNKSYQIQASYLESGIARIVSTKLNRNSADEDVVTSKEVREYTFYDTSKLKVSSIKVDYKDVSTVNYKNNDGNNIKVLTFKRGQTLESSGQKLYLLVNYIITADSAFDGVLGKVYLNIPDEILDGELRTGNVTNNVPDRAFCNYEGKNFEIYYVVNEN